MYHIFQEEFYSSFVLRRHCSHVTGALGKVTQSGLHRHQSLWGGRVLSDDRTTLEGDSIPPPSPLFLKLCKSDNGAMKVKALFMGLREEHQCSVVRKTKLSLQALARTI